MNLGRWYSFCARLHVTDEERLKRVLMSLGPGGEVTRLWKAWEDCRDGYERNGRTAGGEVTRLRKGWEDCKDGYERNGRTAGMVVRGI